MSSSSSTFGRELLTLCGSTLGLFIRRFYNPISTSTTRFRPSGQRESVLSMPSSRTTMPFSSELQDVQIRMRRWLRWCDVHGLRFQFLCCWKGLQGVSRLWFGISKPLAVRPRHRDSDCCLGSLAMEADTHTEPEVQQVRCKSFFTELKEQIQTQGPILLQHCRWAMSTLSFCVLHFSDYISTQFPSILRFSSLILSSFRNSKVNFGEFLQPCERQPLMPHLPGRSHTLRPFSSHSRVWRELWTFNASSTLGIEMHSWHHEMASCKLQIVGFYPFGLNDFESFQSLSGT